MALRWLAMSLSNGGYGVAVAQELVELLVRVQLPVVTLDNKIVLPREGRFCYL